MSEWGTGSVCFEGVKVVGCCTCRMPMMKDESQASQELSSKDNSWGCRSEGYVATGSGSSLLPEDLTLSQEGAVLVLIVILKVDVVRK